jgi:C4-dicarboxylate transporter DctM subunit
MIVYATVTGVSVGKLFVAGIVPGLLFGVVIMLYVFFYSRKRGIKSDNKVSIGRIFSTLKEAGWALGIPVVIIGGIYGGVFTPTEAAAVASVYAVLVALFVYRELDIPKLLEIAVESAIVTAQIMILIGAASVFAWLLLRLQIPQEIAQTLTSISNSKIVILLIINLILVISGMFIDPTSITMIFAPLFLPLVTRFGMDPVHFGIIIIVNGAIGMFTPPFGFNLFVASGITNMSINKLTPAVLPFVWLSLITLLVITFIPQISMWLPNLL